MIRSRTEKNPRRRIAVIGIPRPQSSRLGLISDGRAAADMAYTTISDESPSSADNWISYVIQRQATARETTPGTLQYTPAAVYPAPFVAPWNSWLSPTCATPATNPSAPATNPATSGSSAWMLFGILGAAASGVYLWQAMAKGTK